MTIQSEIAASVDDVDRLLESNAKLSIAYLALRFNRMQEEHLSRIRKLEERLDAASRVVAALQRKVNE